MDALVFEGTLREVRRRLGELPYPDDRPVRVTLEEAMPTVPSPRTRNGIRLLPVRDPTTVLTTECVRDLVDAEYGMRIQLPDVNILVALHDETHQGFERAHRWFAEEGQLAWATCPLTENGFVRVLSQPALPNHVDNPVVALAYLRDMLDAHRHTHHFWPDDVTLRDETLFRVEAIGGHRQVTDAYMLGLCQRHRGTLVTLDVGITDGVIVRPDPDLILRL